jgi:hypothetical protein
MLQSRSELLRHKFAEKFSLPRPLLSVGMKILFINQFFWPDLAPTSVLLTDFARFLEACGCQVSVICGSTTYAGADASARPNVKSIGVPTLRFGHGGMARVFLCIVPYVGLCLRIMEVAQRRVA